MKKTFSLFWLILFLFCFGKCSSPEGSNGSAEDKMVADTIEYTYKVVREELPACTGQGTTPCAEAILKYPVLESTSSNPESSIQEAILQEMTRAFMEEEKFTHPEELVKGFVNAYQVVFEQNEGYGSPWSLEREANVYINTDTIFGLRFTEYMYQGGAHPTSVLFYKNFNPETGKLIKLDSLFDDLSRSRMLEKAEQKFRDDYKLSPDESFESAGYWFPDDKFYLPDNFQLTPDCVIFYYNVYEVAPYAVGLVRIPVKRE